MTDEQRIEKFLSKFVPLESGCWEWMGRRDDWGYGMYGNTTAQRWAYKLFIGWIDDNMQVDHLCSNRACINPDHFEAVPPYENRRRARIRPNEHLWPLLRLK